MTEPDEPVPGEGTPPFALAMVICDAIWRDPSSGKRTLLGCFSAILVREFPVRLAMMSVYIAVTDGHGKTPLLLRLIDVDEERPPVFEMKGEGVFADETVSAVTMIKFEDGDHVRVKTENSAVRFMLMAGAPFKEPIVPYGPFVMNTEEEIYQALADLKAGTFVK